MFDFFGLPRELRDFIYDALDGNTALDPCIPDDSLRALSGGALLKLEEYGIMARATNLPKSDYLCICKQFNHEYRERNQKKQQLVVSDHLDGLSDAPDFTIGKAFMNVSNLHLRATLDVSEVETEAQWTEQWTDLRLHSKWITSVVEQLPHVRCFTIELHLDVLGGRCVSGAVLERQQATLCLSKQPTAIRAYRYRQDRGVGPERWDYEKRGKLLAALPTP